MRRRSLPPLRALLAAVALAMPGSGWAKPPLPVRPLPHAPQRIVSLNLCADQYLIALADPGQIASLSANARDPELSFFATRARALPVMARGSEQVLLLRPDLLIGVPFQQRGVLAPLAARGVPMLDLPIDNDFAGIERSVTQMAAAVGHPARGRALNAAMRARLAAIGAPGRSRVAAYYQRRGYLSGTGTLVDEMMRRAGLVNLATRLGRPALSQLSIEQLALSRPDFLVVESASATVSDRGTELLHHPVLAGLTRLAIPQAMTVCGGPGYAEAVALLATRIRAADAAARPRR